MQQSLDGILDVILPFYPNDVYHWRHPAGREDVLLRRHWGPFLGTYRSKFCVAWCLVPPQLFAFISGCLSSHYVRLDSYTSRCSSSRYRVTCQCPTFQAEPCRPHVTARSASSSERINSRRIEAGRICSYRIWYLSSRPSAGRLLDVAARRQAYDISVTSST